jgi:hypothetical protein
MSRTGGGAGRGADHRRGCGIWAILGKNSLGSVVSLGHRAMSINVRAGDGLSGSRNLFAVCPFPFNANLSMLFLASEVEIP